MIISKADFFGYSLQPTFKGKSRINTVVGGVISLILFCFFSTGFFYMGKEIIEKKNPISNISIIRAPEASIPLEDIPLALTIVSDSGEFLHLNEDFSRAVRIEANLYEISSSENAEFTFSTFRVPIIRCTEEFFGEEKYKILKATQEGIDFFLCPDHRNITTVDGLPYPNGTPTIKKPFGYQNSAHFVINLVLCDKEEHPGCRKGIKSVGAFSFAFLHPQDILNISSNVNPISTGFKGLRTTAFMGLSFSQTINFNLNELVSDEGWVVEANNTQRFYTADAPIYNTTQFSEANNIIGTLTFAMNLSKNVTNRRYMKLQELIANLGGFIKATMVVFSFLLKNYSKWTLYNEIVRIDRKINKPAPTNSNLMVNNIVNSSLAVINTRNSPKLPSFWQFLVAGLNKNLAKKYKINWEECTKDLDLVHMKKQSEEVNFALKTQDHKNKQK